MISASARQDQRPSRRNRAITAPVCQFHDFAPRFQPVFRAVSPDSSRCRRSNATMRRQLSAREHQIRQTKQRVKLGGVLLDPAIPHLAMAEQVLDHMERMFDERTGRGLRTLDCFQCFAIRAALLRLRDHTSLARDVPTKVLVRNRFTLLGTGVSGIREHALLFTVQQLVNLRDICHVAGRADHAVHQPRLGIDADMRLHPEEPLVALLGLVHLRVALFVFVLGGGRCRDQRGIHDRAIAQEQALVGETPVDRLEKLLGQLCALEQTPELQQRRRIRSRFDSEINADETTNRLAVVNRILDAFVREAKNLLGDIHPQHPLQADRRATGANALRIVRFNHRSDCRPRNRRIELRQHPLAPRDLTLCSELRVRKADLLHRGPRHVSRYSIIDHRHAEVRGFAE